jgi:hypothetical protein
VLSKSNNQFKAGLLYRQLWKGLNKKVNLK